MRRVLFVITRAFVILLILNILTNNYFSDNLIYLYSQCYPYQELL